MFFSHDLRELLPQSLCFFSYGQVAFDDQVSRWAIGNNDDNDDDELSGIPDKFLSVMNF